MKRSSLGPLDVLGITLGVVVILIVLGGIAFAVRTGMSVGSSGGWGWLRFSPGDWNLDRSSWQREQKQQRFPGPVERIEVRDVTGAITFAGTEDADVILDTVRTAPNQRSMDALQVQVRQQGSTLIIEEKHDQPPFGWAGSATFDVAVPASVRSIDAKSVSGSISVRGLAPGVSQALETVSGRIDTDQAGDLSASTVSGSVSFVFNGARLKAHAVSGSINGAIDGLARDGSAELSSVSGSIALTAWSGLDAQVSLKSLSGSVSCDFPVVVTAQRSNTLQGKIGTGAARMEASTTSGSININRQ